MPEKEREIQRGPCPRVNSSRLKKIEHCVKGLELLHHSTFASLDRSDSRLKNWIGSWLESVL